MTQKQVQAVFFFSLMVLVGIVSLFLLWSYLIILSVALALAILFRPLFNWFRLKLRFGRGVSALFVTFIVFFAVALPLSALLILLGVEVRGVYGDLQVFLETERLRGASSSPLLHWIAESLQNKIADEGSVNAVLSFVSKNFVSVFSGVGGVFFNALLFFIAFYYFMKDGHVFRQKLFGISPLSDAAETKIYNTVLVAINAVMRGALIIAFMQGALAGIGFWIFGINAPILLGSVTMFASLIPMLGTSLVLVPSILFLFATGSTASGIGFALWSGIAVGLVDNIFKPKLIEQRMKIHPLLILLSILGGLNIFGFLGFIIGPLVLAVAWALAEIYREEYHPHIESSLKTEG
ncbi:MAG: AI-2E family transporter [bacterium]|nr:AI-2E family transporter [bacterium]